MSHFAADFANIYVVYLRNFLLFFLFFNRPEKGVESSLKLKLKPNLRPLSRLVFDPPTRRRQRRR